jgi:hypothetical protein
MQPFVVFSLPRSRSAWLSRFLTYGEWMCGHEELRHMRSLDDVQAWFSQPNIGTAETAGAPWWRLLERFAPNARVLVVRRPRNEVAESLMNIPGTQFDRAALDSILLKLDRSLDQIEARLPNVLSASFDSLNEEDTCAAVFEHCLQQPHDLDHYARLAPVNIQINMPALMRHYAAYAPAMEKLASIAKHETIAAFAPEVNEPPEGITFQTEDFDSWVQDADKLFDEHLVQVGETPGNWQNKNLPLMRGLDNVGAMQIMTARCNGRMFGYLMTLISPSLVSPDILSATNTTFFASPEFPGLGLKLQREAIKELKNKGVDELFFEAGKRGSGPRISMLYKRLGAQDHGSAYRLQLKEA